MNKPAWFSDGFAITAALIWGINYPLVKLVLQSVPESRFLLIRFMASVILLASYLLVSGEGIRVNRNHYSRILLLGLLGVGFYNILWTCGIHRTTAANAALLISTSPIFTGIYAVATKEEKVNPGTWTGTILAFGGVYLIIGQTPGTEFSFSSTAFIGNLLILSGSVLFALYAIVAKPLLNYYSPVKLTTLAMAWGLPVIVLYDVYQNPGFTLSAIRVPDWLEIGFIIVFGTIAAYVFWYKGIQQTSPVKATIFHYIVPVTSMILGAIFLDELITSGQLLGAIFVFLGLIIVKTDLMYTLKLAVNCKINRKM